MNVKNFKSQLKELYPNNGISLDVIDQWCDIVNNHYHMFEGKDLYEISEILGSLAIDGIDEQVIGYSASIIAYNEDAEMNTDKGCCKVFMGYSKSINE